MAFFNDQSKITKHAGMENIQFTMQLVNQLKQPK